MFQHFSSENRFTLGLTTRMASVQGRDGRIESESAPGREGAMLPRLDGLNSTGYELITNMKRKASRISSGVLERVGLSMPAL